MAGPYAVVCVLLVVAGVFKVARPLPTAGALRSVPIPLPSSVGAVRVLGTGEIAVGALALLTGGRPLAPLVAVAYLGFAGFVMFAMQAGTPVSSCGCFGEVETPPSLAHLVVNLGAAATALAAAAVDVPALGDVLRDQPWAGGPFILLVAVCVYLCYAMVTALPVALHA